MRSLLLPAHMAYARMLLGTPHKGTHCNAHRTSIGRTHLQNRGRGTTMFSQISGNFGGAGGSIPRHVAGDGRAAANSNYTTTMQATTSAVVVNAQHEQLYRKNVEGNVNLYRNQRLDKHQAKLRDPLHHKNVNVVEDLPRVGWKVEFESGASDSALSPDMPDYFLTSEFFEVANNETTSALGKDIGHLNSIQHLAGAEHSSGMVTSGKGKFATRPLPSLALHRLKQNI